ncbi:dedicator of cytokinesis protein 9-like [Histomonas meleagridis]|uniref:dedicator of cytokinesis protein 9-like n=1 Tax=Histomonas meleagridis TaxID=135588 RepID=UPI00355A2803|nr:dedicator of cytokinesis protein 9-like [Histomonas meleagridis]KAH0796258.1 dedicator of cytokinesis protein 9-like [Histomonas meleagridis]
MKQVIQTKDRSTKERFNSLSKEELSHIGWLSYLSEMPTSNLIIPDPLPQVESDIILDYVCEEGLSEPEPKNDGKCSVRQLTEELNSASKISFKYHSIPIVDLATRAKQKSLAFPYTEDKPFKYIKIKNIKINNRTFPDISETCFINFFVYTSYPITETIFCEVPINSPKFARYQHQSNTVTLPFPPDSNPEPILVLLLFKFDEFQLANGRPHVVGRMPLSGDPSKIKIDWYNYQHGKTICEIFETEKLEYADSKIDFEFLDEFSPDDSCRFTSFDPMYPSPLLTLHNIRIKFQHCLFPKKARAFISFSLKKNFADPKCQDPRGINAFILPTSKEPNEIGYSSIIEYADEIVLPEPINFILDPSILESITLTIDVNIIEKGKTTNVLTSNIQISKPIEEHVNKMESKGFNVKAALSRGDNILKMTSIYPTLVCPPPNIRGAFSLEEFKIDDPMIKSIAPYVINQRIRTDSLPVTDIKALFMFFRYSDMSGLQSWIEHFFTPEPGFSHAFASYVTQNLLEISDWPQPIFLLLFKINAIFPMTQMKLLQSRVGSVSLLNWLINTETKINKSCSRCEISFQLSLCETIFKNSGFIPFWSPDYPVKLSNIYNNISKSLCNQITYERTVEDLLKLYQEFQNFPSIRASIYQKIVSINEENDDYCAAFVTQWKLCALIAEVFKLKGIKVGGIPTEGISAFMYVNNEPVIDITVYPKTSSYLVMESKLFNEDSMSESLQKAMELCIKAKINWIIGDITVFLFDFLEKRRQFALLKKLFNKISTVYADLQKSEETQIQFARITLNKTLANKLKFNDVIHCYPKGEFDAFVNKWKQNFNNTIKYDVHILSDHNVIPWESDTKQTNDPFDQQIIQVNEDHNQLLKLEANTFTRDVMMKAENWNDPILTRYTFETENVLPGCSSLSKVKSITKKEISKEDYYEERLTEFRDKLKEISENYRAVVPTGKSTQVWGQYILGISNTPLLKLMSYVFNAEQEDDNAYYWLVYQYHIGEIDVEPPLKIAKLCDEIWQILIETIPLMQAISKINAFSKSEQDQFDEFRKRLGITIVSLE